MPFLLSQASLLRERLPFAVADLGRLPSSWPNQEHLPQARYTTDTSPRLPWLSPNSAAGLLVSPGRPETNDAQPTNMRRLTRQPRNANHRQQVGNFWQLLSTLHDWYQAPAKLQYRCWHLRHGQISPQCHPFGRLPLAFAPAKDTGPRDHFGSLQEHRQHQNLGWADHHTTQPPKITITYGLWASFTGSGQQLLSKIHDEHFAYLLASIRHIPSAVWTLPTFLNREAEVSLSRHASHVVRAVPGSTRPADLRPSNTPCHTVHTTSFTSPFRTVEWDCRYSRAAILQQHLLNLHGLPCSTFEACRLSTNYDDLRKASLFQQTSRNRSISSQSSTKAGRFALSQPSVLPSTSRNITETRGTQHHRERPSLELPCQFPSHWASKSGPCPFHHTLFSGDQTYYTSNQSERLEQDLNVTLPNVLDFPLHEDNFLWFKPHFHSPTSAHAGFP
ncbi:uncharacterized protein CLUP02_16651 [Colletotrichum lupini]|uniref:Uncharacterized protein n=1 Tax=Colletotrichum lupini TaxID=145971 RepID=A0A9Q8WQ68_9PEZI|nr:uncharacterized protein CLUP02_16651 [Colletotrichum lupini]UQC91117.1 hypothetical protein CLUP02_16651 [Colletotrichum lupini]